MRVARSACGGAGQALLDVLADSLRTRALDVAQWDRLVRVARAARLLGVLGAKIEAADASRYVPEAVMALFRSERAVVRHRTRSIEWQLDRIAQALGPLGTPVVLLKGAAYLMQRLRCADGRLPMDVDVLVPRERIGEVERALLAEGWELGPMMPYDERYYREWSHELPPFRYGARPMELDVHHAILPPLGRICPDPEGLLARSRPTAMKPFRVLAMEDQVIHVALHVFQDSDCVNRLRDLVDFDALVGDFASSPGFWSRLTERAAEAGAARPLGYALRLSKRLLGTSVPAQVEQDFRATGPRRIVQRTMDALMLAAIMPPDPDRGYSGLARFAASLLLARSVWLRFPPRLVLLHATVKAFPRLRNDVARLEPR